MKPTQIVALSAGLRTPSSTRRLADQLTSATQQALAFAGYEADVHVIELSALAHDIMDALTSRRFSPALAEHIRILAASDALIATTPIYTAAYSGLFKSFFDILGKDAIRGLPVLFGATGGSMRHQLALDHSIRPLFAFLGADPVNAGVFATQGDWDGGAREVRLDSRIYRASLELVPKLSARSSRHQNACTFSTKELS